MIESGFIWRSDKQEIVLQFVGDRNTHTQVLRNLVFASCCSMAVLQERVLGKCPLGC